MANGHSGLARFIRVFAVPIVLGWILLTVVTNVAVPPLEKVGEDRTVGLSSKDGPAFISMKQIGANFQEFDSDSTAMIVLEGDQPLGDEAHRYYDQLVDKLEADTAHVQHVADFWGDPLTASGAQSADGKAAYVQLYLHGNQGEPLANESVEAIREIVDTTPAPPGMKTYVTGAAPLIADQAHAGDRSIFKVTLITIGVIAVMLLLIYRSIATMLLILVMVFIELGAARGIVAFLATNEIIGLSTFAVNLLTLMVIAAGTDYAIFSIGRYQEARGAGDDREAAFYTMFHGTAHVILGSG
ncbi:MAG TPA: MMPL family transporter, partial [Mycobacterium sp.]|nr:MMPL family transporter [Mycobacterium sp.]